MTLAAGLAILAAIGFGSLAVQKRQTDDLQQGKGQWQRVANQVETGDRERPGPIRVLTRERIEQARYCRKPPEPTGRRCRPWPAPVPPTTASRI